jgi:hypothetical protein
MKHLTPQQRYEIYARISREITDHYLVLVAVPNIVGPVYGAHMCDRAIKPVNAVIRLLIGLEDALPDSLVETAGTAWKNYSCRGLTSPRDALRARSGEPPLGEDAVRQTTRSWSMPPLSLAEHRLLGADLKAIHSAMVTAGCDIANAGGKRRDDLVRRVRKVERFLLTLRSHLDGAVQREYPTDAANWHTLASIYFGTVGDHGDHGWACSDSGLETVSAKGGE